MTPPLNFSKSSTTQFILPQMANRHGLISGATGTGKTVSLRVLAEAFSDAGVPVFMADVKGDLASLWKPGAISPKFAQRLEMIGVTDHTFSAYPVRFWDVDGKQGHPVRATVSDMGPLLLARLMNLNDTQTSVLNLVFQIADDQKMLLIDFKDLRSMLQYVGDHSSDYTTQYGTISKQTIGAIQRGLMALEGQGAESFFGEPALELADLMAVDSAGKGFISLLAADRLFMNPLLYSTLLLWLMSELFEEMPEVGDLEKPKLVFFFDEAHLLFKDAPKALLDRIEQVVRLIRSKGVGIYFISQSPLDIPENILGQLGHRVQHALRAFTPKDQKAVKAAAETFRANPALDVETVITELAVGEALVSFLDSEGRPGIVERAWVLPPHSMLGTLTPEERSQAIGASSIGGKYEAAIDRVSAFEMLQGVMAQEQQTAVLKEQEALRQKNEQAAARQMQSRPAYRQPARRRSSVTPVERMAKSAINTIGRQVARDFMRGLLGTLKK